MKLIHEEHIDVITVDRRVCVNRVETWWLTLGVRMLRASDEIANE